MGMFARFVFHFLSGVIFFGAFAPAGWSPILYSLAINGAAIGGELIIDIIIIKLLPLKRILKL